MLRRLSGLLRNSFSLPESNLPLWDGWRGLAILAVLIGHFGNTEFIKEDRLGVDIFFVLSGMLMARLLFEKRTDLKTFYIRRFSRIFPALLVFVLCMFGGATVVGWHYTATEVIANLIFIRTYFPADPHIWSGEIPVKNLWSLNVEEHAYVIMSLMTLLAVSTLTTARLMFAIALTSVAIGLYYNATQVYTETWFLLRTEAALSFIMVSAAYRLFLHNRPVTVPGWAPVLALLLAACCYLVALPFWMSFVFPPFLLAFSVNHLQDAFSLFQSLLSNRVIRLFGLWSYSIYLWQQPMFEYKWAVPGPDFALPVVATVLAGLLSHAFIESPARSAINNWWARRSEEQFQPA